eukprot:Protomagalhaensia_sp_Gyna_25__238@NODE_1110_length_2179_cov_32_809346_g879_i0_p1_GENE_NODE_1110_length_2179_cov_32_809346_g879_i0NODE_1110_length_2179_cov_32_809346_g879_i0_p1_ORF_typecomplete_len684_score121_37_NODE_1110_length_2179_cov_32_809346_g879_i0702121
MMLTPLLHRPLSPSSRQLSSEGSGISVVTLEFTPQPPARRKSSHFGEASPRGETYYGTRTEPFFLRVAVGCLRDPILKFGKLKLEVSSQKGGWSAQLHTSIGGVSAALSPRSDSHHQVDFNRGLLVPFEGSSTVLNFALFKRRLTDKLIAHSSVPVSRDSVTGDISFLRSIPLYKASRHAPHSNSIGAQDVVAFLETAVELVQAPLSDVTMATPLRTAFIPTPTMSMVADHRQSEPRLMKDNGINVGSLWIQGLSYCAELNDNLRCWLSTDGGASYVAGSRRFKAKVQKPLPLGGIKLIGTRDTFHLPSSGMSNLLTIDICGESQSPDGRCVVGRAVVQLPSDSGQQRRAPFSKTLFSPLMSLDTKSRLVGIVRLNLVSRAMIRRATLGSITNWSPTVTPSHTGGGGGGRRSASPPSSMAAFKSPLQRPSDSALQSTPPKSRNKRVIFPSAEDSFELSNHNTPSSDTEEPLALAVGPWINPSHIKPAIRNALYPSISTRQAKQRVAAFAQFRSMRMTMYAICGGSRNTSSLLWNSKSVDGVLRGIIGGKKKRSSILMCTDSASFYSVLLEPAIQVFSFAAERFMEFELKCFKSENRGLIGRAIVDLVEVFGPLDCSSNCRRAVCIPLLECNQVGDVLMCVGLELSTSNVDSLESHQALEEEESPQFGSLLRLLDCDCIPNGQF